MKRILIVFLLLAFAAPAFAKDVQVRGYTRKDGTYVQPYVRSSPDSYKSNNYGNKTYEERQGGYSNPYTRDSDRDGVPNYLDTDDDNDGRHDDFE